MLEPNDTAAADLLSALKNCRMLRNVLPMMRLSCRPQTGHDWPNCGHGICFADSMNKNVIDSPSEEGIIARKGLEAL